MQIVPGSCVKIFIDLPSATHSSHRPSIKPFLTWFDDLTMLLIQEDRVGWLVLGVLEGCWGLERVSWRSAEV